MKIAIITPKNKNDYLTNTVIDGFISLKSENPDLEFYIPNTYSSDFNEPGISLNEGDFMSFANTADLVIFCWGKDNTDYEKVNIINRFSRTIFIDGSEVGGDRRYDSKIREELISEIYNGRGAIDKEMESKCALYFKREKPYLRNIIPFSFGIERSYSNHYSKDTKKDIDFFCVFGRYEDYAPLRKEVKEALIDFCKRNNFTCFTEKTEQENFYKMLARSKVGVSVGGGGFDTARFWEILGNNCILLTEKIDIYDEDSDRLKYERIFQFSDSEQFKNQLEKIGESLKERDDSEAMFPEYEKILSEHSTKSRALEIIQKAKEKGIID